MKLEIPPADLPVYSHLPTKVRKEVSSWIPEINALLALNGKGICNGFKDAAPRLNVSWATVRTKFYAVLSAAEEYERDPLAPHPWKALINKAKLGNDRRDVPSEFIPYWHALVAENKRNTKAAYDRLSERWIGGVPIPGFPACERGRELPSGLSLRNLRRKPYMPTRAQIALARQGVAAARPFLPHAPQDVSEVRFLEYILFDDVELDFLIVVKESTTPVKIRLIVAMDLSTRRILGYAVRPGLTRPDGVEDGLKLTDMKAVVMRILSTWGVPDGYTMTMIVERGTAAIPKELEDALHEISGGRIAVSRTSMIVGQVFEFRDKATGNSWGKAWLESFFNPLHGALAHVEGQKGRRYDLAPAELEGRRKELAAIVRAGQRMPMELRYQFRYPFRNGAEALQELDVAFHKLHSAEGRNLQGFAEVMIWRLNAKDSWKSEAELLDYPELIGKVEIATRPETILERSERLASQVQRIQVPDCSLQRLMDEHREARFMDYQFSFEYQKTDYVYLPPESMLSLLQEGTKYLLWFHPQDMSVVYVTRAKPHTGYIGKLTRFTRARRGDLEEAKARLAEKQRIFNHALKGLQEVDIDRFQRRADDLEHNAELLKSAQALEMEVDYLPSKDAPLAATAPDSVRAMTEDIHDRKAAVRRDKKLSQLTDAALSRGAASPVPTSTPEPTSNLNTLIDDHFCR